MKIFVENMTGAVLTINDLGVVISIGSRINVNLYCSSNEVVDSQDLTTLLEDNSLTMFLDLTGGTPMSTADALDHISIQTKYEDAVDEDLLNTITGYHIKSEIGIFNETKTYTIGETVLFAGLNYNCILDTSTTTIPMDLTINPKVDPVHWDEFRSFPKPIIGTILPNIFEPVETNDVIITGDFFTSNTMVIITNLTVNSINVINSNEIHINITSPTTQASYSMDIITSEGGTTTYVDAFKVELIPLIDLRTGGATFTDGNATGNNIRYRSGMSMVRDANGVYFNGSSPLSSWVKFEMLGLTRGENKTLTWIFDQPSGAMMIGISSTNSNEMATDQYCQGEVHAYFPSTTSLFGLYGNNGTIGTMGSQSSSATLTTGTYKVVFSGDGTRGSMFYLYKIPSTSKSDWADVSNLIHSFVINSTLSPNETDIMPVIMPREGSGQYFIALLVQ